MRDRGDFGFFDGEVPKHILDRLDSSLAAFTKHCRTCGTELPRNQKKEYDFCSKCHKEYLRNKGLAVNNPRR